MSRHQATASTSKTSTDLFPPAPVVRASNDREQRLTDYVRGHTGADITVCLSAAVETAFVVPTTETALVEADQCDLAREEANQVVEQVESEYVIAIPTQPARLEQLPIDDQLTADRAQQFGFALHELGHIRYTDISESAALLDDAVEETHKEFVHSLWNLCEDAAIEQQLAADQSQIAADRLALLNQSLSPHETVLSEETPHQYTFRDAVERALFDWGIYETGLLNVLCDREDDRLTFQSTTDQQAYEYVADDLRQYLAKILTTPDSIARTERVLECWQKVLKPLLNPIDDEGPSQSSSDDTPNIDLSTEGDTSTTDATAISAKSDNTDTRDSTEDQPRDENPPADTPEQTAAMSDKTPPPPEAINTERTQASPRSNVLAYPAIGETEPAEQLAPDDQSHPPSHEADTAVPDHHPDQADDTHPDAGAIGRNDPGSEPAPTEGEKETPGISPETADASPSVSDLGEDGQTTLSLFSGSEPTESEQTDETGITPPAADQVDQQQDASDSEQRHSPMDTQDDHRHTDHPLRPSSAEPTDETTPSGSPSETAASQTSTVTDNEKAADEKEAIDQGTTQPASTAPANTIDQLDRDNALAADEQAAHQEADRVTPDERALDAELWGVAEALDDRSTGSGATPDSLDELSLLPDRVTSVDPTRWGDATASAQYVGNTLRTALRESQRDNTRSGLTSGTFDRRRIGTLARGEINVFQVRQPGEEKNYDLVLVLDRSWSMRNCITIAENALIRFALACEEIGINVAVIDFVAAEARLVKPFRSCVD